MSKVILQEYLTPAENRAIVESIADNNGSKNLYMKGICIQGDIRNANQRIYPVTEIKKAVNKLQEDISNNLCPLGEVDHPSDLKINLDRVSHVITEMWMDGANGYGKLKILPTPMGNLIKTMLESGVKLGVSSRGSGNVNESNGHVSDFEIVTVDIVATPSAPHAYPQAVYEGIMNMKNSDRIFEIAHEVTENPKVQKYLKNAVLSIIKDLKLK